MRGICASHLVNKAAWNRYVISLKPYLFGHIYGVVSDQVFDQYASSPRQPSLLIALLNRWSL